MVEAASSSTSRERVRAYRRRQRARGLRAVTLWMPDVDDPKFQQEVRRQSSLIGHAADEREAQALIDSLHDDYMRLLDEEEGPYEGIERSR